MRVADPKGDDAQVYPAVAEPGDAVPEEARRGLGPRGRAAARPRGVPRQGTRIARVPGSRPPSRSSSASSADSSG
jgi:hypothetical protein